MGAIETSRDPGGSPSSEIRFEFQGRGDELFLLGLKNLFLMLVTLGIYLPWARTEMLRYVIGNVVVDGDPLAFHGRGGELLRGLLIAVALYVAFFVVMVVAASLLTQELQALVVLLFYASFLVFVGLALFGAYRYRVTRTSWRSIRFAFHGNRREFLNEFMTHTLLVLFTLGWGMPFFVNWQRGTLTRSTAFGTRRFASTARASR